MSDHILTLRLSCDCQSSSDDDDDGVTILNNAKGLYDDVSSLLCLAFDLQTLYSLKSHLSNRSRVKGWKGFQTNVATILIRVSNEILLTPTACLQVRIIEA